MFGIRVTGMPLYPSDILHRLRSRSPKSIGETLELVQAFDKVYGKFGFEPCNKEGRQIGAYYLRCVDERGQRCYEKHEKSKAIRVEKSKDTCVTWIEFLQETLDPSMLCELNQALEPSRIHVFTSACKNFCVGGSAGGDIDIKAFLESTSEFAALHQRIEECSQLPLIVLCNGATRGGGMLFPSMAHVVISTVDATFGYPEVRRGLLPGVVSISAQRRMTRRQCRSMMLTGHVIDADVAMSRGLVDSIVRTSREDAVRTLHTVVGNLSCFSIEMLKCRSRVLAADGDVYIAVIESGNLGRAYANHAAHAVDKKIESVSLTWHSTGVACLEIGDPDCDLRSLSWKMGSLVEQIQAMKGSSALRAVVLTINAPNVRPDETETLSTWISGLSESSADQHFENTAANLNHYVSVCTLALSELPVPVVAVLRGMVSGAWLALSLSADYRLASDDTLFDFNPSRVGYLFDIETTIGMIVGEARWNRFLIKSAENVLTAEAALKLGIVSNVQGTDAAAMQTALDLSTQIASAPDKGIRNALSLLRLRRNQKLQASKCVSMARTLSALNQDNGSRSPGLRSEYVQLETEDLGFAVSLILVPNTKFKQLLDALVDVAENLPSGKPILILQSSVGDLEDVSKIQDSVLSVIEWFRSKEKRATVVVTCHGTDLSLLLPLLADMTIATGSSTFQTEKLHPVVYSCLAYGCGVTGCGRLMCYERAGITAIQARDIGVVHELVDSLDQSRSYISSVWASEGLKWHQPPTLAFAEAVVMEAETLERSFQNAMPQVSLSNNGTAHVRLTSAENFQQALDFIESQSSVLRCVFVDASNKDIDSSSISVTFMSKVRFLASLARIESRLKRLSVPVCTLLNGNVSALVAAVTFASSRRVGMQNVRFDFTDDLLSAVVFGLTDALPSIVGVPEAEILRLQRPIVNAADALSKGLLTDFVGEDPPLIEQLCLNVSRLHDLEDFKDSALALQEQAERCLAISRQLTSLEVMADGEGSEVVMNVENGVLHLRIRSLALTSREVETILTSLLADDSICIFYFEADNVKDSSSTDFESCNSVRVVQRILTYKMPVIVVCRNNTAMFSRDLMQIISAADAVIASTCANKELTHRSRIKSCKTFDKWTRRRWNNFEICDIVVDAADIDSELTKLTNRFKQISSDIIKTCKSKLPASSVEESGLVMASLKQTKEVPLDMNFVNLAVSADGIATLELNDPNRSNAETPALVAALRFRLHEVSDLVLQGKVKCLVLQGAGPHFCSGAFVKPDGSIEFANDSDCFDLLNNISATSEIAIMLRKLPIPTLAAVQGKVIGGGLALCLAVDWRVCTNDTKFVLGNISQGMNPIFMLSRALPLTVGWGRAMQMYLEDKILSAEDALANGLVNFTVQSQVEAKQLAYHTALAFSATGKQFHRSRLASICASDKILFSKEVFKLSDSFEVLMKQAKLPKSGHEKMPVRDISIPIHPKAFTRAGWASDLQSLSDDERISNINEKIRTFLDTLGVEAIDSTARWFEAGLDSLSMVELQSMLSKALGETIQLRSSVLFDHPTLGALVNHINSLVVEEAEATQTKHIPSDSASHVMTQSFGSPDITRVSNIIPGLMLDVRSSEDIEDDLLICLQAGNLGCVPIIMLYGGWGVGYGAQLLGLLNSSWPLYATQAPEYASPCAFSSFEERARHHKCVFVQKFGLTRLHLVGYSYGAVLASEIARLFDTEGVTCTLTLLDPVPCTEPLIGEKYLGMKAKAADDLTGNKFNFLQLVMDESIENEFALNSKISQVIQNKRLTLQIQHTSQVAARLSTEAVCETGKISQKYQSKKFLEATIFVLSEGLHFVAGIYSAHFNDIIYGWSSVFEKFSRVDAVGGHLDFFIHKLNVESLAKHLDRLGGI